MSYTVSVEVNRAEVYALLTDRVRRIGNQVANVARRRVPKASGKLAVSLHTVVFNAPGFVVADVGTDLDYGIWVHEGTGIYGPTGRPITSPRGGVMKFVPGRSIGPLRGAGNFTRGGRTGGRGGFAYARSVKGQPGSPYLTSALADVVGGSARIRRFGSRGRRRA